MLTLIWLVNIVCNVLQVLIIIEVIFSWIPEARYRFREVTRVIDSITEPIMRPFRRLLPPSKTGGLDLSPMLALISIGIIRRLLIQILAGSGIWR